MPIGRNISHYTTAPPNSTTSEPQATQACNLNLQTGAGDVADYDKFDRSYYYDTIDLQQVANRNQVPVSAKP